MRIQTKRPLNSDQKKAVENDSYPIFLQAGAGSGKTHALVEKVIRVLDTVESADLTKMALITFTNKATDEMAGRLQVALYQHWLNNRTAPNAEKIRQQIALCSMVQISTIHSFCETLLRQYGYVLDLPNTFSVRSFNQQLSGIATNYINQSISEDILRNVPHHTLLKMVLALIDDITSRNIPLNEATLGKFKFETPGNDFFNTLKPIFLQICVSTAQELANLKLEENAITLNDLFPLTSQLLDDAYALYRISLRYNYIFMDEFQDTSLAQFLLLQKLIQAGVKAFIIGDKKQSIYAFRGADIKNAERIEELTGNKQNISMNINYRTDPLLLQGINEIFQKEFYFNNHLLNFPKQPLESGLKENLCNTPLQVVYEKGVISIIEDIVENYTIGERSAFYGDIAILCRRNFDLEKVAAQLKNKNIPVEIMGGSGFYSTAEIIDTYKLLNAIIYKSQSSLLEAKNCFYYRSLEQSDSNLTFTDYLDELEALCKTHSTEAILNAMYEKSHAMAYLRSKKQYQAVANLLKLLDKAKAISLKENIKPLQFLEFLDRMTMAGKDEDEAEVSKEDRAKGVVSIYTIHKAKGLEFPIVLIPNCDLPLVRKNTVQRIIFEYGDRCKLAFHPDWFPRSEIKDRDFVELTQRQTILALEEELRILYVACTRAKNALVLSCTKPLWKIKDNPLTSWAKWIV